MAAATIEMIKKLKFKLLLHPAYSPDLVSSGYHMFNCTKVHYMDTNLQTVKRSRTWCICDFACNQKHYSQMASGSSRIKVTNMWKG
jgi:hypothetical protein